jgi:hypothetical protein
MNQTMDPSTKLVLMTDQELRLLEKAIASLQEAGMALTKLNNLIYRDINDDDIPTEGLPKDCTLSIVDEAGRQARNQAVKLRMQRLDQLRLRELNGFPIWKDEGCS